MKISIKTDADTLILLHKMMLRHLQFFAVNRAQKSKKSLYTEIFGILNSRCLGYSSNPNGRKLTLTLKFHLADALLDILDDLQFSFGGIYESNKLNMFRTEMHQKLL